jgi:hypothetical protein
VEAPVKRRAGRPRKTNIEKQGSFNVTEDQVSESIVALTNVSIFFHCSFYKLIVVSLFS